MSIYLNIAELASRADIDSLSALFTSKLEQHLQVQDQRNKNSTNIAQSQLKPEHENKDEPENQTISRHFTLELLLYFLPETLDSSQYAPLIFQAYNLPPDSTKPVLSPIDIGIEKHIAQRLAYYGWKLNIHSNPDSILKTSAEELLTNFVKCRVRVIDDTKRELSEIESLLVAFPEYPDRLVKWQQGCVNVLKNFRQFYTTHNQPWIALHEFESATSNKMVKFLLQYSNKDSIFRDLNTLVVPYSMYYKTPEEIWNWVGSSFNSSRHLELVNAVVVKGGLTDPDIQPAFLRHVFALMYLHTSVSTSSFTILSSIVKSLESWNLGGKTFLDLDAVKVPQTLDFEAVSESQLSEPSVGTLTTLRFFIDTAALLQVPVKTILSIRLFGSAKEQEELVHNFIFGKTESTSWKSFDSEKWERILKKIQWMKSVANVFNKIEDQWLYKTFLEPALATVSFTFIRRHYIDPNAQSTTHISADKVNTAVLDAFYQFFDTATNGNKTRGQMKNANNCLQLLNKETVGAEATLRDLENAQALLSAADDLSSYSLYLSDYQQTSTNGLEKNMPITPKQIRLYPDPAALIHRVLELNPKAYLKMDQLVVIAFNIIKGRQRFVDQDKNSLPISDSLMQPLSSRIRKMCIEAALVDANFEKAFELSLFFMTNSDALSSPQYKFIEDMKKDQTWIGYNAADTENDIETWASLFQVGKFISPEWDPEQVPLGALEKKMTALSYTLKICPSDQLSPVLSVWKRLEKQLDATRSSELSSSRNSSISESRLANLGGGLRDGISSLNQTVFSSSSLAAGKTFYNIGSSVGKNVSQTLTAAVSSAPSLLPTNLANVLHNRSASPSSMPNVNDMGGSGSSPQNWGSQPMATSNSNPTPFANKRSHHQQQRSNDHSRHQLRQSHHPHQSSRSSTTSPTPMRVVGSSMDHRSYNDDSTDINHFGYEEGYGNDSSSTGHHTSTHSSSGSKENAKEQISNLLVSGLGWAIGANPR